MAITTEHISIRLPKHIVMALRKDAVREQRSLSWMIGFRLAQLAADVDSGAVTQRIEASGPAMAKDTPHNTDVVAGSIPARSTKHPGKLPEPQVVIHDGGASLYVRTTAEALSKLKGLDRHHDPATCRTYKCGMCAAMKP